MEVVRMDTDARDHNLVPCIASMVGVGFFKKNLVRVFHPRF